MKVLYMKRLSILWDLFALMTVAMVAQENNATPAADTARARFQCYGGSNRNSGRGGF
ncbi:MAG: hypothetical protein LBB27_00855 [Tannerellaceae bacterium]|jgi:hypothetical protein|nr:hypothetical protein [Tannerellaceae bacterium]